MQETERREQQMIIEDPVTGKKFCKISHAVASGFCQRTECVQACCPVLNEAIKSGTTCGDWMNKNQKEAAKLIGFEVIEEVGTDLSAGKSAESCRMDKPLREWTLEEYREFHRERLEEFSGDMEKACNDCPLCGVCAIPADEWDLSDIFRLTKAEREILLPFIKAGARWLSRGKVHREKVYLWGEKPCQYPAGYFMGGRALAVFDLQLFPSVRPGDCLELEEAEG